MINKLNEIINKYNELADQLSKPEIISDLNLYKKISQEYSGLKDKALIAQNYIAKINEIQDLESIVNSSLEKQPYMCNGFSFVIDESKPSSLISAVSLR